MGGDKLRSYRDVGGVWTACMGVTEGIGPSMTFTEAQCADLSRQKLVGHEKRLLACAPEMWDAPAKTYVAINDWAYNVGTSAACSSTLIKYARKGQWRIACEQLSRWVYVKGAVIRGLVNRRINDGGGRISERPPLQTFTRPPGGRAAHRYTSREGSGGGMLDESGGSSMKLNEDGKFLDRLVPAILAAALAVAGSAMVFWKDSAVADSRAMDAISRIDREIDGSKRDAVTDRQKKALT